MKRQWLLWLLVFVFVWVVIARFAEISELAATFASGVWWLVLGAAALQLLFYVLHAVLSQVCFATVRVTARLRELVQVLFSAVFVNVAVPTGGVSGVALIIDNLARNGQSPARAAAALLLVLTVDFSALTVLVGLGLAYLATRGSLYVYEIAASAILVLIIGAMSVCLVLSLWRPSLLLHLLKWVKRLVNRVGGWVSRPDLLPENWAARHAMDFSAASIAIAQSPLRLGGALVVAFASHLVSLASLYLLFLAFGGRVDLGTLVAGYAVGNVFWIVSITPQGVGVVEGVMALVFTSLGVAVATAAVVVLAYRGLGFWLPMLIGFILLRRLHLFREPARPDPLAEDLPPWP